MPRFRLISLTTVGVVASLTSGAIAAAQETSSPKPFEELSRTLLAGRDELSRTILAGRDSLVRVAKKQVGLRYRFGANQPGKAFDCSALVQWIAGLFGREMPRTAAQQAKVGLEIPKDTTQLLPGDLLFFGRGKRVDHIGIYVGEGKYVHAANRRKGVIESEISRAKSTYWKGTRRIFYDADSALGITPEVVDLKGKTGS